MKSTKKKQRTHRLIILPLPLWLLYGAYRLVAGLVRRILAKRATSFAGTLPHRTTHQQDKDCARLAWLLFAKLNHYRLSRGLPQVVWNEELEQSSLYHGQRMAEMGEFAHELSDGVDLSERVKRFGYVYSMCAENLAYVESPHLSIEQLAHEMHDGWVHSPGHHANLVGDCEEVGIGVVKSGYRYYSVQNFGTPLVPHLPRIWPRRPAPRVAHSH